jgi:DNA transformation protein
MTASDAFVEHLKDSLRELAPVTVRRMFGGAGVYADGVMFGLVADDTLYLKVDDETKSAFEAEGLAAFTYESNGRSIALSYWRIPERLLDDPDEMLSWAKTALGVAGCKARRAAPRKAASKVRSRA